MHYVKKVQEDSLSKLYKITPFIKYKEMLRVLVFPCFHNDKAPVFLFCIKG